MAPPLAFRQSRHRVAAALRVAGPPAWSHRRNDMVPTQSALLIDAPQRRMAGRIRAAASRWRGLLAMVAALALGLAMAGAATAGDDGPRVKRHDEARVSAGGF